MEADPPLSQRTLGTTTLVETNALIEITPALITAVDDANALVSARACAPVIRLTIRTNGRAQGNLRLNLSNLHTLSNARLIASLPVAASASFDTEACPRVVPSSPSCNGDPNCLPPTLTMNPGTATQGELIIPLAPCRRIVVEIAPPAAKSISYIVIGSMDDPARLATIFQDAIQRAPLLDFAVILGDAADSGEQAALDALAGQLRRSPVPVVVLPGEREADKADAASRWQRSFGPLELRWTMSSAQFLVFPSVGGTLPTRGLNNLQSALRAMRDERTIAAQTASPFSAPPVLAFTHVPPFDPSGLREAGFTDRLEAARVMSTLGRYGVQALFAGHLREPDVLDSSVPIFVTTAQDQPFKNTAEYLLVSLSQDPLDGATGAAGDWSIKIERIPAP